MLCLFLKTMTKRTATVLLLFCLQLLACLLACKGSDHCSSSAVKGKEGSGHGIKGMFVFGSSLVDNGNNNYLQNSTAKADFLPYGIDFPHGPSGRFTNGKNVIDLLGEMLEIPSFIPTFSDPSTKGSKVINGVNFASAASGILDDTGFLARQVTSLNQQIRNFEEVTMGEVEKELGCGRRRSRELLGNNYLFVVGAGGNDYSFNYFLREPDNNVGLQAFTANLTNSLSHQLKKLYNLGARKFVLMSVNPLGCVPMVNGMRKGGCIKALNQAATLFNHGLKSLIDVAKSDMPSSNLVFVNSYNIIRDIIKNPASKGKDSTHTKYCSIA
ncbi:hypothetical protein DITRI_Ditri05aG0158200 [Diplodiscus trichospermus]